jgi:hypothetical protein
MGYAIAWTAVRGKGRDAVLAELELRPAGEKTDSPSRGEPFCGGELADGWFIVLASASEHDGRCFLDETAKAEPFLASLSRGCEVVACFVEEHVMCIRAAAWREGRRLWNVIHDAQVGSDHLEVEGQPPGVLASITKAASSEQNSDPDGPDYLFEVPGELAKAVCGFKHDEGDYEFDVLEPTRTTAAAPARRSLLSRLFGR